MNKVKKFYICQKGVLSIEASIVLSVLLFFVFFLMDFGTIYRAQNYMAHGAIQTAKTLSYKAYEYETVKASSVEIAFSVISFLYNNITREKTKEQELKVKWRTEKIKECVELVFYNTVGKDENNVKQQMIRYGIDPESVDFNGSGKENDDIAVIISYKIKLKYPFFNFTEITLRQKAKSRKW